MIDKQELSKNKATENSCLYIIPVVSRASVATPLFMKEFDVFGIENALMDIHAFVSDEFLTDIAVNKGIMHLIDEARSRFILKKLETVATETLPGGSCANTMSTIAFLGGKPVYTGVVSEDRYGRLYEERLQGYGIKTLIKRVNYGLTGTSIILTTPDAERTMNTHLGVCRDYTRDDVNLDVLKRSQALHITGYMWDTDNQKDAALFAMQQAKSLGIKISFDMADPFLVDRNKADFPKIIAEYVDILFGNAQEVTMLMDIESPLDAGKALQQMCEIAVVKIGKDGSYVITDTVETIPVFLVKAVDTTGAGDSYAGGFLYAYCQGKSLAECGRTASYIASQIVTVKGLGFPQLDRQMILAELETK